MLIDSHCHLQFIDYKELGLTIDQVLEKTKENDVGHILCVATKLDQHKELTEYAERYNNVTISTGIHPNEVPDNFFDVDELLSQAANKKVVAIGETGLDYYRDNVDKKNQQRSFIEHINVAKETNKSLIIHTRQAREDTIEILKNHDAREVGGVFHCFTEDWEMAKKCLDLGFYISFSGIVTFKNAANVQEVAKKVPLDRVLVETDSPYLAPVPYRGKINQPAYVKQVASFIADLKSETYEKIAEVTTDNYQRLFGI